MPLFRDDQSGLWSADLSKEDGAIEPLYAEALTRYLNTFDPLFRRAQQKNELEFLFCLFRVRGVQDAGWDPYETTQEAVGAVVSLHKRLAATPEDSKVARHLALWLYGHIVEASEPYELLANLLEVAGGSHYNWGRTNFPPKSSGAPRSPGEKIGSLRTLARKTDMPAIATPLEEIWDRDVRNAVFHADYTLSGDELRLTSPPGKVVPRERRLELINRALAYQSALDAIYKVFVGGYDAPKRIATSEHFEGPPGLEWVVIVREGHGAVGVKDGWAAYDEETRRIPLRIGQFYEDEIALLNKDPSLSMLPRRQP